MAKTYTASAIAVSFGSNKSLLALHNTASNRMVKLTRAWVLNNQLTAVIGCLTQLVLRRISSLSGGISITPAQHHTGNTSTDLTGILCATGAVVQPSSGVIVNAMWNTDEPAVSSMSAEECENVVPLCLFNGDTIQLPAGYGVHLGQPGINGVGVVDVFFEFTVDTLV